MKISFNTNINITKYNFCAGKTKLYTDFDGTYFPFFQYRIADKDQEAISKTNKMYQDFRNFINIAKENFSILITTGRSAVEMSGVLNLFKKNNIDFNSPDGYIFRNGVEEISRIEDKNFDSILDTHFLNEKENIKQIVRNIDNKTPIIESISTKLIDGRENETLPVLFEKLKPKEKQKYISMIAEDSGTIELAFFPDVDTKPYIENISKYYKENNIPIDICSFNNCKFIFLPYQENETSDDYSYVCANAIIIKHIKNGKKADKLNKPKEEVKEIVNNNLNDLVIVAGDDSNDVEMLNPLNYIDVYGISVDKNKSVEDLLQQEEILSAIYKLPLISIVTGRNENMNLILKIKNILDKKGIRKIYIAKNPSENFLKKVKQGILSYSNENDEFKYNLGYEIYREILR